MTFLAILFATIGILALFVVLVIWGHVIGFDRRPEDPPPASWLAREGLE